MKVAPSDGDNESEPTLKSKDPLSEDNGDSRKNRKKTRSEERNGSYDPRYPPVPPRADLALISSTDSSVSPAAAALHFSRTSFTSQA
jgi:hypothetical protein